MTKILIADDHTLFREGLRSLLSTYPNFEVVAEAPDGESAIRLVEETKPNVVLMDIGMPGMHGFETLKKMKEFYPDIHVLILSQYNREDYLFAALKQGASGYVLKETASHELVAAIENVVKGNAHLSSSMTKALIREYVDQQENPKKSSDGLTAREEEVLKLLAGGCTSRQIAERFGISIKTAQSHAYRIMEKLNLHNRAELVKYAIRKGMVPEND